MANTAKMLSKKRNGYRSIFLPKNVKSFSFSAFNFACSSTAKMFNINQAGSGDISMRFTKPDADTKKAILYKAIDESREQVKMGEAEKKFLLEYEHTVTCK